MRYWPLLIVVAGVALGLGLAWFVPDGWRLGCLVVGCSLGIGAMIRLLLPRTEAGLLQVRSKPFDVAVLALAGVAIVVLALSVPPGR